MTERKEGTIFNIQRFCITDGDGIRTTVFFKGCPLRCKWCHNPESQTTKPQLLFKASRCVACAANDLVLILLWVLASLEDSRYISVVVCFAAFFVNDLYGYVSWRRMERKQAENG